jgi:S-(hydroxymethyl)glutathione dehydrogenase / alcohol dehydrogenase
MKVKAAVLRQIGAPLSIEEIELAAPKQGEVLVKYEACGFCHSDLSFWMGRNYTPPMPQIMGHEACGIVEKVGPCVTNLKKGDRVVAVWTAPCGHCYQCLRGRPNICETNVKQFHNGVMSDNTTRFTDKKGKMIGHGLSIAGFSTYSVLSAIAAVKVPDDITVPTEHLCQLGCSVLTGWGSVTNAADLRENDTIGIWGCGGVGLNAINAAARRDCRLIVAVDINGKKEKIAREFGATHFIDSTKQDPIPVIKDLTGGWGLEFAMEAIGDPGAQVQALWSLRSGGTMIFIGITPQSSTTNLPLSFLPPHINKLQGTLYGNTHPTEEIPYFAKLMSQGVLKTDKLVTRIIKLEQLEEARQAMEAHEIMGRWVIKYD